MGKVTNETSGSSNQVKTLIEGRASLLVKTTQR